MPTEVETQRFAAQLRAAVRGDVLFDVVSRGIYATDASHYQVMPTCVVVPRDEADVLQAIRLADEYQVPITARGGGTSLSGQTTWNGMVLDFTKYMDAVLEVNVDERWVRVQPGVICDRLNAELAPQGLHFAPDPATGSRAAIGGMIGNNSSGTHSIIYGKTSENIISCRVALADGTLCEFAPTAPEQWQAIEDAGGRLGELYRGVREIFAANQAEIAARFPKTMRRVSGYALDAFLPNEQGQPGPWNLAHLITGSEGTLGILLDAKLKLHPLPNATALCVVHFHDVIEALEAVVPILQHAPSAVELLDDVILHESRSNSATAAKADFFAGEPQAIQIVELIGNDAAEAGAKAWALAEDLEQAGVGYARLVCQGADVARVWEVRKLGLGLLTNVKGARKGIACIEDAAVPVEQLPEYIRRVRDFCDGKNVKLCMYAHASVGVIHARPMLDLHDPEDVALMRDIAWTAFRMVQEYGGSWASEHGDGLLRGEFIADFYGPQITAAFRAVKQLFDPRGIMNPGKIIEPGSMTDRLRYGNGYQVQPVQPRFHYREQGGFALAVEQCAGIGACRKIGSGTMCPSYMATRDEEHTTRGRANALRLAMTGQLDGQSLTDDRILEVLELCLSCKACKTECPTSVDMSRLKSDVLQMRYRQRGTPWLDRLLGNVAATSRLAAGRWAWFANRLQAAGPLRWLLARLGIDRRRPLPRYASQTLASWFQARGGSPPAARQVVLFCDTFANYFEPHVGQAAVELLEGCGYQVLLADVGCCQRPPLSRGLVDQAARDGLQTLQRLDTVGSAETPLLVLEPSCASALADDLPDLIDDQTLGERIAGRVQLVDAFLAAELQEGRLQVPLQATAGRLLIHGHCHQKALFGTQTMKDVLAAIADVEFEEVDAGCCGMAGSFGYQHYDLSKKIGEDRLFPAVRDRANGTEVVACGISCRHQLHDFLGVQAKHWVEVVRVKNGQKK